jgi:hypothetical protein
VRADRVSRQQPLIAFVTCVYILLFTGTPLAQVRAALPCVQPAVSDKRPWESSGQILDSFPRDVPPPAFLGRFFEPKAADVIGLYVNPPDHAAVAVDEKTAIQALDRLDPVLPLSPGRAERHGFEYYRHATEVPSITGLISGRNLGPARGTVLPFEAAGVTVDPEHLRPQWLRTRRRPITDAPPRPL